MAPLLFQFAIRPNIRNHTILSRDSVIKQVADIVGPSHTVDLKSYDLLILVEIYKVRTRFPCALCRSSNPAATRFRGISFVQRMTIGNKKSKELVQIITDARDLQSEHLRYQCCW